MRFLGEKASWEKRTYEGHVPTHSQHVFGSNVRSAVTARRLTTAGADRLEQGNTWNVPVQLGRRPPVCS